MSKQDYRKARKKAYELPRLAVGDVLLVGKFKNRKATITGFSSDENNQPVAQTDKGDQKIFKPRIAKLMPAKQRLMAYCGRADPPVAPLARLLVCGPAGDQSDNTCTRKRRQGNEFDYDQRRHADLLQGLGHGRARRVQPRLATECR